MCVFFDRGIMTLDFCQTCLTVCRLTGKSDAESVYAFVDFKKVRWHHIIGWRDVVQQPKKRAWAVQFYTPMYWWIVFPVFNAKNKQNSKAKLVSIQCSEKRTSTVCCHDAAVPDDFGSTPELILSISERNCVESVIVSSDDRTSEILLISSNFTRLFMRIAMPMTYS